MSAVADEQTSVHFHAGFAQGANFLKQGQWVKHHPIANHTTTARTQDAARNELKNELLPVDDDSVPGIVAARVACHNRKIFRENVDNLALAFVTPLRTYDDCSLTLLQCRLHGTGSRPPRPYCGSHTLYAQEELIA